MTTSRNPAAVDDEVEWMHEQTALRHDAACSMASSAAKDAAKNLVEQMHFDAIDSARATYLAAVAAVAGINPAGLRQYLARELVANLDAVTAAASEYVAALNGRGTVREAINATFQPAFDRAYGAAFNAVFSLMNATGVVSCEGDEFNAAYEAAGLAVRALVAPATERHRAGL